MARTSILKASLRLLITIFNAVFVLSFMLGAIGLAIFFLARGQGMLLEVEVLEVTVLFLALVVVISPFTFLFHRAEKVTHHNAPEVLDALKKAPTLLFAPRLYLVDIKGPNAFAVGWWPVSFIGISYDLLELARSESSAFSQKHLEAVVLHELGHHVLGHALLMPPLAVIVWFGDKVIEGLKNLSSAKSIPLFLFAGIIGWILKFPQAALSQEFERSADTVAALFAGSPDPLCDALTILGEEVVVEDVSPLARILSSHPGFKDRTDAIKALGI